MNYATIAYLPSGDRFNTQQFLVNITKWKTKYPLFLYADIGKFGGVAHNHIISPDNLVSDPLHKNNITFMKAIDVARARGVDAFLYLEEDCRVRGDMWDDAVFGEFNPDRHLVGGTPSLWNTGLCGHELQMACIKYINKVVRTTGRPPIMWQRDGRVGDTLGPWLYPNGALGVYNTDFVDQVFHGRKVDIAGMSKTMGAWDMLIGRAMWQQFGVDQFEKMAIFKNVYSGYKDSQYTMAERQKMLVTGQVVGVHQIKDRWTP